MGKTESNSKYIKTTLISLKGDANQFLNELIAGASKNEAPKEEESNNHKREDESHHHRKRKRDEERKEIIPLHLRPRKLNFWDQRPEGYANMSADQVKATGMFLLPSHLLKGNGSFTQPSIVQPYGGTQQVGYANHQNQRHRDPEKAKAGYHTQRIYLSGLAGLECTNEELGQWLCDMFEERGLEKEEGNPVESMNIHEKGFAFAEMRTSQEATLALSLNGSVFMGNPIKVARPKDYRPPEGEPEYIPPSNIGVQQDPANKIFIGGLPQFLSEDQIKEFLTPFGELKSFNLVKNQETGLSKGYAFCEFLNPELTDMACEGLNGLEMGDKKLIVQRAHVGGTGGGTGSNRLLTDGSSAAGLGKAILPIEILGASGLKHAEPTPVLLLLNLYDVADITNASEMSSDGDDFADEVYIDVLAECERFGTVIELVMPRPGGKSDPPVPGAGKLFCKYGSLEASGKAQRALAGRKFNGRTVCTTFYEVAKFDDRIFG